MITSKYTRHGLPVHAPVGTTSEWLACMILSAVYALASWVGGDSCSYTVSRMWRVRACMSKATHELRGKVASTYLALRSGPNAVRGSTLAPPDPMDATNQWVMEYIALADEYEAHRIALDEGYTMHEHLRGYCVPDLLQAARLNPEVDMVRVPDSVRK